MADTGSGALRASCFASQSLRAENIQPIQPEFHAECDVAAVVYGAVDDPDAVLAEFIQDLRAQGFDAVGLLQRRNPCLHDISGPVEFFLIPDEVQLSVSQDPLTLSLSPRGERTLLHAQRVDFEAEPRSTVPSPPPYPLADMATLSGNLAKARLREKDRMRGDFGIHQPDLIVRDLGARLGLALARRLDVLVLNRFGWLEACGSGLLSLLAAAIERDVPVAIAVPEGLFDRWLTVAQGLAVKLRCDRTSLDRWWQGVRRIPSAAGPHASFCECYK